MTSVRRERALAALDEARRGGGDASRVAGLVRGLGGARFDDPASLLRFHETLLFLRAHPPSREVLTTVERLLAGFEPRVNALEDAGADMTPFLQGDVSGVAGVELTMSYGLDATRWLVSRHPRSVRIDWDGYDGGDRLGETLPRFIPLLEEEAAVDANVRYREWLAAARRAGESELAWLLSRFDGMPASPAERAELYDALGLFVTWRVDPRSSRTRLRAPAGPTFLHDSPFLSRRNVDLARELSRPPLLAQRLSARAGARLLEVARAAMAVRYRELLAFTHGDPRVVLAASPGRGVELHLVGIERARRLPLRCGFGLLVVKNGVPLGYGDVFALFERVDVSFNVFPPFREGESAWIYAQVLRLYASVLRARSFAVDPYQIGLGNDEAVDSGAFWFYRKLGFRCAQPELEALARREEKRLSEDAGRRTSRRVLKRLAEGGLVLEHGIPPGQWDRFHVRNIGLAMLRRARGPRAADDRRVLRVISDAKRASTEVETLRRLRAVPGLRESLLRAGSSRPGQSPSAQPAAGDFQNGDSKLK